MNYALPGGVIEDGWRAVPRNIHVHSNTISNSGSNPNGKLITDIIAAYDAIHGVFPSVLYDGLGEAIANSGLFFDDGTEGMPYGGVDFKEPPFAMDGGDNVCVSNNGNVTLGQLYAGDHSAADLDTPDVLLEHQQDKLMNCAQTSLPVHTVTFGDQVFGCGIDDGKENCGSEFLGDEEGIDEGTGGLTGDGNLDLCGASGSEVNWAALQGANCPNLSDYNLFADAMDPTGIANGGGLPYEMNTALFTDYSTKYRYVFVPGGEAAAYTEREAFDFPVGSVLVKTFAMPVDSSMPGAEGEELLETRLLILRETGWSALPYIWTSDKSDAVLTKAGGIIQQSIVHDGEELTFSYGVPNINQCKQCHQLKGEDDIARFAPIGPKARNLNSDYDYGMGPVNQLSQWVSHGILTGLPADMATVDKVPEYGLLGEGDLMAKSDAEIMGLAKGYLDINCAHCHRPEGNASNTGMVLEFWRPYEGNEQAHGTCKAPTAYGGGHLSHDIVPGDPESSILHFRMDSTNPGDMMPEIGRSLSHDAGVALIHEWIKRLPAAACSG